MLRSLTGILLSGYLVAVAFVVFWPTPVDRLFDVTLLRIASVIRSHGMVWLTYDHVEFVGNILLFVPIGLGLTVVVPRAMHWIVPIIALVSSTMIEIVQWIALPDRFGGSTDVVANVLGATLGWTTVLLWRGIARIRAARIRAARRPSR